MIEKMKKVSIVVLNSERKDSLKRLRRLGLVHLETVEGKGPVLASFKEASANTDKAVSVLDEIKVSKKAAVEQVKLSNTESDRVTRRIVYLSDRKKSLIESINQNKQEKDRLAKWGRVNPSEFDFLGQKGIYVYMYEIAEDKYALIGKECKTVVVNTSGKVKRFLLVSDVEVTERPSGLPPEAYAVPMPEKSTEELEELIESAEDEIISIEKELADSKKYRDSIASYREALSTDIEFEIFNSGISRENEEVAESVSDALEREKSAEKDNSLAWLTGYVPVAEIKNFEVACKENCWAFTSSDPVVEDPTPTKLKNNKFVSLIYPLTDFLDVTPGYNEFDISGWFLLFFCIFFAMIFGDAGYGAIIALIGLLLLGKSKKGAKSTAVLITLLGLCTMMWGVMTCSWFGIDTDLLPDWMKAISFAPVAAVKVGKDAADKNQQVFCFLLALVQLSIAHVKCLVANRKSLKCIGDFGALIQLWGTFYVVMSMVVDSANYPLVANGNTIPAFGFELPPNTPTICLGVLLFGFLLNFIFSNYEESVVKSILESMKNIISVLLGVVNVFSDIVSYIRLWAVALAGAAIAGTVNEMAGPLFGKLALVVCGVILLVFGHGLNMILNVLSVVVHGVRLNTLEFSQHLGMTWSGTKYRPFSEKAGSYFEVSVADIEANKTA